MRITAPRLKNLRSNPRHLPWHSLAFSPLPHGQADFGPSFQPYCPPRQFGDFVWLGFCFPSNAHGENDLCPVRSS